MLVDENSRGIFSFKFDGGNIAYVGVRFSDFLVLMVFFKFLLYWMMNIEFVEMNYCENVLSYLKMFLKV